ncbi:uncharacterized protein LOC129870831 [Solanum dulcamara]|uniref:uncharacterized protein LOC129870831 n=1 Tax=Solanum dulcamara TaxID=45834 RepID=UPI0024869213|nr:uncharacterized protein LOC129870831 [Solanum dulcamara]
MLAHVMSNQVVVASPNAPTLAFRVRNFARMNPLEFHNLKVDEDPQEFIDDVYKVVAIFGQTSKEKAKLVAYQLKGVAHVWYSQWKSKRVDEGPIGWEDFKLAFLDRFLRLELREERMREFIYLKKGNMSISEYTLKFTKLSNYAPSLVSDPHA